MNTYFISDLHLGHKNAIDLDNRPFDSIEQMDETLIQNWNSVVKPEDHIWILGDLAWKSWNKSGFLLKQLKGKKHLIIGNHDKIQNTQQNYFATIDEAKEITVFIEDVKYKVVMSHYPIPWYNGHRHPNRIHLYGHVHLTQEFSYVMDTRKRLMEDPKIQSYGKMFNIGAMMPYMDYMPQSLENIVKNGTIFNEKWDKGYYRDLII